MDRDQQIVVLHPPQVGGPGAIALCAKHVDRVTTPAGWEVRDLRASPSLEPDVPVGPAVPVPAAGTVTVLPSALPSTRSSARRTNGASADLGLHVDDGATPLLGRAFRAASPGELRRPGESRGFAWLERDLPAHDADLAMELVAELDVALGEGPAASAGP
jgi:hypothetical protein